MYLVLMSSKEHFVYISHLASVFLNVQPVFIFVPSMIMCDKISDGQTPRIPEFCLPTTKYWGLHQMVIWLTSGKPQASVWERYIVSKIALGNQQQRAGNVLTAETAGEINALHILDKFVLPKWFGILGLVNDLLPHSPNQEDQSSGSSDITNYLKKKRKKKETKLTVKAKNNKQGLGNKGGVDESVCLTADCDGRQWHSQPLGKVCSSVTPVVHLLHVTLTFAPAGWMRHSCTLILSKLFSLSLPMPTLPSQ